MFWPLQTRRLEQPEQVAKPNENLTGLRYVMSLKVFVSVMHSDSGISRDYVKDVVMYMYMEV